MQHHNGAATKSETKDNRSNGVVITDCSPSVLTIIDVDQAISDTSESIEGVCNKLLNGCQCTTPSSIDIASECTKTRDKIYQSIMRFRKDSDRWIALASVLLKSTAFHRSVQESLAINVGEGNISSVNKVKVQSIVDLPRTKFNRPYIPHLTMKRMHINYDTTSEAIGDAKGENEDSRAKFSVSHQYPYIAIVQTSSPRKIGLDLVVFDFQENEFVPTINDFLKAFEGSFTPWEWERIQYFRGEYFFRNQRRSYESKLKEFYLRWAMKEAYVKAMGLGMYIDFASFETRLLGIDDTENNDGIWNTIKTACEKKQRSMSQTCSGSSGKAGLDVRHQYSVRGRIRHIVSKTESPLLDPIIRDMWEFIFIPFSNELSGSASSEACCCICRELDVIQTCTNNLGGIDDPVVIEEIALHDLIRLHMQ
eukprot:scaffold124319_cov85-Cyclotella_meneghiniana.AAC.2